MGSVDWSERYGTKEFALRVPAGHLESALWLLDSAGIYWLDGQHKASEIFGDTRKFYVAAEETDDKPCLVINPRRKRMCWAHRSTCVDDGMKVYNLSALTDFVIDCIAANENEVLSEPPVPLDLGALFPGI